MTNEFSTTCLAFDGNGRGEVRTLQTKVTPGEPLKIENGKKIALAGGFPSLSPDSPVPLSPTLQLNGDLAESSKEQLATLAQAELYRLQAIGYRTSTMEIDFRVCVIANDRGALEKFIDTYGGILEIDALLLNTTASGYPSITEAAFEEVRQGCRVRYRKRSPLRHELCSYCGKCAQQCPENCISPMLDVDYSRCTFCKECEKVCGEQAIDIYGIEEVVVDVPAVIMLDENSLELPEQSRAIYTIDHLQEFFATLYSCEIQEVVCHNNSICQYSGRLGTGCTRCVDSCAHSALATSANGIEIDHLRCTACGKCVAVCPTGAMQNGDFEDGVLLRYLDSLDISEGSELIIGEEEAMHRLWWQTRGQRRENAFYLEYPALSFLSFVHLLLFFTQGFRGVTLLCDATAAQRGSLLSQVDKANSITTALFDETVMKVSGVEDYIQTRFSKEPSPHPLPSPATIAVTQHRRDMQSQILHHMIEQSQRVFVPQAEDPDFPVLDCNTDACTRCLACLNECTTEALQADRQNHSLTYLAGHCVGCGVCVSVCPENVLRLQTADKVDQHYLQRREMARAEPVLCKACGKEFGTRKSLDKVMQILASRESVNTDHFEYCADCRVIKLFETEMP